MPDPCDAELCDYWTGQGCACLVLGIERPDFEDEDEEIRDGECDDQRRAVR